MTYDKFIDWWTERGSKSFDALLFDIDGTLISGGKALPGAEETLEWLRDTRYPFRLLTNDGNHSPEEKSGFLHAAGLQIGPEEIISCCHALDSLAQSLSIKGEKVFVLGDLGKPSFAERAGLVTCREIDKLGECAAIIVGEGEYDWQPFMTAAINALVKRHELFLITPNPDTYWPDGKGGFGIGAGATGRFIAGILKEMGMNIEPIYLGKPYPAIYDYALDEMAESFRLPSLPPKSRVLMLGDSLSSDMRGAHNSGIKSGLLLTGITSAAQAEMACGECRPDMIFKRLG